MRSIAPISCRCYLLMLFCTSSVHAQQRYAYNGMQPAAASTYRARVTYYPDDRSICHSDDLGCMIGNELMQRDFPIRERGGGSNAPRGCFSATCCSTQTRSRLRLPPSSRLLDSDKDLHRVQHGRRRVARHC